MAHIEVGLSMLHSLGEPFSRICQRLQKVSVDYVELVDDGWHRLNPERVKQLKKISEDKGLTYTLHAPFANINIAAPAEDMRNFILERLEKSMAFARQLECRLMVFHPGLRTGISGFYPGMAWKTGIKSVQKLLKLSREYGVEIAIENVPQMYGFLVANVEQFSRFFNELGEDIGLVFDVGHSNINGQTHKFVEALGKRIVHVHAHDNDGKHDLHLGVGDGTVNWQQFAEDIKNVDFEGIVIVESYHKIEESIAALRKLLT